MKKLHTLLIVLISLCWIGCEESDDIQFVENGMTNPVIVSPSEAITLSKDALSNKVFTLVWNDAELDTPTVLTYTVEMAAAGTEFATPVLLGTTAEHFISVTTKEFNDAAIEAGLTPGEEGAVELRVMSSIGSATGVPLFSESVTFYTTPFTTGVPQLFMVGAFQAYYGKSAWTPTEAIEMNYVGDGTTQLFEAYCKLGAEDGFKFITEAADWSVVDGNYGTIGGVQDGTIENAGTSSDIKGGVEGFYYVQVDIDNLTYQLIQMDWGIIGNATPSGWDGETAMTYNFEDNQFMITQDLVEGEMKLRSKNTSNAIFGSDEDWKYNVGDSGADAVATDSGDGNFAITTGNKTIVLDIQFNGVATTEITNN
ncbi:hypothetical protein GCM10022393_41520 [Aquimarina addita]|uniref:SusE outer membrane protein domain-containing protein n=1 Tax=Aquimarina addita TaxID=870485 RepID=A0ABP6UXA4_9FLAO